MMKFRLIYLLLSFLVVFTSCRSRRIETRHDKKETRVDSIYKAVNENQFEAEWFSGKFKALYQMPDDKKNLNGQVRIRKDSVIWVSVYAMMNIEVLRLEVRPDTFRYINRLDKTYIQESTKYLKDRFNVAVDFEMLQAILLGNDFPYYETDVFKLEDNPNTYHLSTVARKKLRAHIPDGEASKILVQDIWVDKSNFRIVKQNVKIVGHDKAKLRVRYGDFENFEGNLLPMNMIFRLKEDQNTFLEINFTKVEINKEQRFPFKIPKKYQEKKIDLKE